MYLRGREEGGKTYGRKTLHHWGFTFEKGEKRKRQNTANVVNCSLYPHDF